MRLANLLKSLNYDKFNVSKMSSAQIMSSFKELMPGQLEFFEKFVQPIQDFSVKDKFAALF